MEINRHNYEPYFIDFVDGKLNADGLAMLHSFLAANPDLASELEEFKHLSASFSDDNLAFPEKNNLKRNINDFVKITDGNFDEFCVALFENDLNEASYRKLVKYVNEAPKRQTDFNLYSKTFLKPDRSIIFPKKSQLKRRSIKVANPILYFISAAAAISLIVIVYKNFNNRSVIKINPITEMVIPVGNPIKSEKVVLIAEKKYYTKVVAETSQIELNKYPIRNAVALEPLPKKGTETIVLSGKEINPLPIRNNENLVAENLKSIAVNDSGPTSTQYAVNKIKDRVSDILPVPQKVFAFVKNGFNNYLIEKGLAHIDAKNKRTIYSFDSKLLSFYSSHENK